MSDHGLGATADGARHQALMIGHGSLVVGIGLLSGFGLMFELLGEVAIWPIPAALEWDMPGTARGWQAAHVGGILNGVMIVAMAVALPLVSVGPKARPWVVWGLVFTGWANTIFYLFGNLAPNRGLSGGDNALGEGSAAGLIAYVPAAVATVITTAAVLLIARAAFRRAAGVGLGS